MDVAEACPDVDLGEVFGVPKFIHDVRDEGEGVTVLDRIFVEFSVVLRGAEFAVLFVNKEEPNQNRGFGDADSARGKVLIDELIEGGFLILPEGVYFRIPFYIVRLEVYRVIPLPVRR